NRAQVETWQLNPEKRTVSGRRLEADRAAEQMNQLADDPQPEPGAAFAAGRTRTAHDELAEQPILLVRRNARPFVLHKKPQPVVAHPRPDRDRCLFRAELDRVAN